MDTTSISAIILTVSFIIFLAINMPVAISIGLSTFLTCLYAFRPGMNETIGTTINSTSDFISLQMATGIDSFMLLAIPFFVLAGLFMGKGGIARRLIELASALVGRFTGGLAYINILTCMFMGALSGSSIAAVSAVGGFMIPEMNKKGYDKNFNVAVTTTAATTGLMIPPSNIMIVYALVAGEGISVIAMFMAGILPGIVFGLMLMVVSGIISRKRHYGAGEKSSILQILKAFKGAILSLLLIVIVLGGILSGYFTATEAAAVAVLYSFILAVIVYREVKIRDIPGILLQCGVTTSVVMFLIATSMAMSQIMTTELIPQRVSSALIALSQNEYIILLIINVLLLFVGTFMDMTPAVLIFTPIFLPVIAQLGMSKIHFGLIMIANLCIGICTPPVGTCLFVGCGVGNTTIVKVLPSLIPFFIAMIVALMLITYIPALSLFIPQLLHLI